MVRRKVKASGRRTRRTHNAGFKARGALAALREDKTLGELCEQYELRPNQITEWEKQLLERAPEVFGSSAPEEPVDLAPLHAKIGRLALENDFLEPALAKAGVFGKCVEDYGGSGGGGPSACGSSRAARTPWRK